MNLRNNSQPDVTLHAEQSTSRFIWSVASLRSLINSCKVLAVHFSKTRIKVLMAATAVANSGSDLSKCSNVAGTSTPLKRNKDNQLK